MIKLDKRGNRIEVRSRTPLVGMKAAVPGAYLNAQGVWTVPLSMESCILLRQTYGDKIEIGTELHRWASTVRDSRRYMSELAASGSAKLEVLPQAAPKLYKAMQRRKYQKVGARFVADSTNPLIADDPGLGKTLESMGGIIESQTDGPYLVVAPKTATEAVWRREIEKWLPSDHRAITLPEGRDARERVIRLARYGKKTWLIVHPEIVLVEAWWVCRAFNARHSRCHKKTRAKSSQIRTLDCGHTRQSNGPEKTVHVTRPSYPKLFDVEWGAIIADESHDMLIKRNGSDTQRRRGMVMLPVRADGKRIASSGTPFDSKPEQLWGTLNWLDPKTYPAYHRWAELFWETGGYTGHQIGAFRKDRENLLWQSLSSIALRRTKAEVADDLPPKTHVGTPFDPSDKDSPVGVWLPMDSKQAKAYEDIERLSVAELDSGRLETIDSLTMLTRLKQLATSYGELYTTMARVTCEKSADPHPPCGRRHREPVEKYRPVFPSNKFQWTLDALEEWGFPDNPLSKVVIVSQFTGILNMFGQGIEKHFKTKPNRPLCSYITGMVTGPTRRHVIEEFNKTDKHTPQVMLLNIKAGGTAITLDTADRMITISHTRSPDKHIQAEDRIHRVSNPRKVFYYDLYSLNTVDVGTAHTNVEAEQITRRLLDGRRGVEYFKHVLELSHGQHEPNRKTA